MGVDEEYLNANGLQ
jgi:hypothetical protein